MHTCWGTAVRQRNTNVLYVQAGLQDAVLDDFKMLLGTSDVKLTPDNIERLGNACLVVNALGPKVGSSYSCLFIWLGVLLRTRSLPNQESITCRIEHELM